MLYLLLLILTHTTTTVPGDTPVVAKPIDYFYPTLKSIPKAEFGKLPPKLAQCVEGDCKEGEGVYLTVEKQRPLDDGTIPVRIEIAKGRFSGGGSRLEGQRYTDAVRFENREPVEFYDPKASFKIVKTNYVVKDRQPKKEYAYRYDDLLDYHGAMTHTKAGYEPVARQLPQWSDKSTAVGRVFYLGDIPVYEERRDGYRGIPIAGGIQVGMHDVDDPESGVIGFTKPEFEQALPHLRWRKYGLDGLRIRQLATREAYVPAFTVINGRPQQGYYTGTRKDGVLHGNGVFHSDSLLYVGRFKEGRPDGAGFLVERPTGARRTQIWVIGVFVKGGVLEGAFRKSFYQDPLTLDSRPASPMRTITYEGTLKKGRPHGCGELKGMNFGAITEATYEGYIKEGQTIGWATLNGRPVLLGDPDKLSTEGTPEQRSKKDMAAGNVYCGMVKPKDLEELYRQGKQVKVLAPVVVE